MIFENQLSRINNSKNIIILHKHKEVYLWIINYL